jgi:predicted alpha/beta-hydrolase family hydrolase
MAIGGKSLGGRIARLVGKETTFEWQIKNGSEE